MPISLAVALLVLLAIAHGTAARAAGPGFDCKTAKADSIEVVICSSRLLSELDAEMTRLYGLATSPGAGSNVNALKAEQVKWIKDRGQCAATTAKEECARNQYLERITWLRTASRAARSADAKGISLGPAAYQCDRTDGVVSVTFVNSEPRLAWLTRRDKSYMLEQKTSASGARYEGFGTLFWEHQGEAQFKERATDPEVKCKRQAAG